MLTAHPGMRYALVVSANSDNRLQAEMLLVVEHHQVIVGLEGKSAATTAQGDVVLFAECDRSTIRLVQDKGVVFAEMFC